MSHLLAWDKGGDGGGGEDNAGCVGSGLCLKAKQGRWVKWEVKVKDGRR